MTESASADVSVSQSNGVLEVRFNRPTKKNAITLAMYAVIAKALEDANGNAEVRAVLFTAAGETFSSGNDIMDFASAGANFEGTPQARLLEAFVAFEKPLVAAVHGPAIGIGATMLLHCDLVYASETARLRMPFVSLGLVPEAASSLLLPKRVGQAVAAEMLLLGAWVEAARALQLGLVNAVVPATDLEATARAKAGELAALPPNALRTTRALLRGEADRNAIRERIRDEGVHFAKALGSAEAREAFTAFVERRTPDFSKLS